MKHCGVCVGDNYKHCDIHYACIVLFRYFDITYHADIHELRIISKKDKAGIFVELKLYANETLLVTFNHKTGKTEYFFSEKKYKKIKDAANYDFITKTIVEFLAIDEELLLKHQVYYNSNV